MSESAIYRRQILMYKYGTGAEMVNEIIKLEIVWAILASNKWKGVTNKSAA